MNTVITTYSHRAPVPDSEPDPIPIGDPVPADEPVPHPDPKGQSFSAAYCAGYAT